MRKETVDNILFIVSILITVIVSICLIACQIRPTTSDEDLLLELSLLEQSTIPQTQNLNDNNTNNNNVKEQNLLEPTDCQHQNTIIIVKDATCKEIGIQNTICYDCKEEIAQITIPTIPHKWEQIIVEANCERDGEVYDVCSVCKTKENIHTIPKLGHKTEVYTQKATCTSSGEIKTVCTMCNRVISTTTVPQKEHKWKETNRTFATPINDGIITYECTECKKQQNEYEPFVQKGTSNLCIPAIEMNCEVILAECNQTSTDLYDISCDMNFINNNNPVFFGHNTRSLSNLHKLKVGDIIYFTQNGITITYRIIVSEEGYLFDGKTNIKGKETGELCISNKEKNTLHFFTCYQTLFNINGRWIVLAEKVE